HRRISQRKKARHRNGARLRGKFETDATPASGHMVFAPTAFTYIEYIDVLPAMNRRLRLCPPNTKLETISGVWIIPSRSPCGLWTRMPLVSAPPQPHEHQTLPSVSQRTPSV